MKSKVTTYLLGLVVMVVWGLIIYRVIDASGGDDTVPAASAAPVAKEPMNDYSETRDTAKLLLNYRDPFAPEKEKDTAIKTIPIHQLTNQSTKLVHAMAPVKPQINWSFITYTGYIRNPRSKQLLALVHLNGQELILREGETAGQVRLLKNLKDSIKIAYQGSTKYIVMNSAAL